MYVSQSVTWVGVFSSHSAIEVLARAAHAGVVSSQAGISFLGTTMVAPDVCCYVVDTRTSPPGNLYVLPLIDVGAPSAVSDQGSNQCRIHLKLCRSFVN